MNQLLIQWSNSSYFALAAQQKYQQCVNIDQKLRDEITLDAMLPYATPAL
jgi:hypothetical protein